MPTIKDPEQEIIQTKQMTEEEEGRVAFVRDRFQKMAIAKSYLEQKFQLAKQLDEAFEKHLTQGENWNDSYRFPEIFGAIQRKASDLIENLPEVKVHAKKMRAKDFAIATQAAYDHCENITNAKREKVRCIYDTLFYGTGILYEGYVKNQKELTPTTGDLELSNQKKVTTVLYDGLASERIDPRDFFVDETATIFYDETGLQGARDCVRRRIYPFSTFRAKFKQFKNASNVPPMGWGSDPMGWAKMPYEKESQEQKQTQKYVTLLEYWSQELDCVILVANGIEIYFGANPYKHKRLPFVLYYNYRRDDSVWGVSEVEVLAPFTYAKEELNNLFILDAKLALQPAIAVSGEVTFNPEENELQPGAIFTLRGLNNGKVQDSIMPLRFGGISPDALQVYQHIEDAQIIATGDDIRSLYANPGQLATQTLAKREASQKRIKSNIMINTIDSERQRAQIRISNINQFYAQPYLTVDGNVEYHRIKLEGYEISQGDDESKPTFRQAYGAQGYFVLNAEAIGNVNDIEVEIIDVQLQESLKKEEVEDCNNLLKTMVELVPLNPQIAQGFNVLGLVKQIAKKMNIDYYEVFPQDSNEEGEDAADIIIQLIGMGEMPEVPMGIDPQLLFDRLSRYSGSAEYKESSPAIKALHRQFIIKLNTYAKEYLKAKLAKRAGLEADKSVTQGGVGTPGQLLQGGAGEGVQQLSADALPAPGGQGTEPTPVTDPLAGSVAKRQGFGTA